MSYILFYSTEAQTRLINYSHSSGALARTNSELNAKLRNYARTQKVLEFRIGHLTKIQQDQKEANEKTQNEYESLVESVRESNRTLQIEHQTLQEQMHDTLGELARAKANVHMIKLEKTKDETDNSNHDQLHQHHEEEKQRLNQLLAEQETTHKTEQERLRQELTYRSQSLDDAEVRYRQASEQIQGLQEEIASMSKLLSEAEERKEVKYHSILATTYALFITTFANLALDFFVVCVCVCVCILIDCLSKTQAATKIANELEDQLNIALRLKDDIQVELDEERQENDSLLGACDMLKASNDALKQSLLGVIREIEEIKATAQDLRKDSDESSL